MAEIEARYADAEIAHLDGVSVDYDDWHFNVRPSNTEPLLRLCLESLVSHEDMERRRDEVLALIRALSAPGCDRAERARSREAAARRHPLPADPDAVPRRARQLLPDRGRPADARRHAGRTPARRSTSSSRRSPRAAAASRTSS